MPGLYNNVANVTVPDNDTVGLYQTGSNIAILNSAGALLSILDNSGNVHFQASPGGATVNASVTFAPYTNTNVAAYLPTDPTILTILSTNTGLQNALNTANTNIGINAAGINTLDYNIQSINNEISVINSEITILQAQNQYGNNQVAAYLPTDPTILTIQGNISTLTGNTIAQQNAIGGLQIGLNTANSNIIVLSNQVNGLQSGLNAANASIGTINSNVFLLNATVGQLQNGLNTTNATISGVQGGLNTTNIALGNTIANVTTLQSQIYTNVNLAAYLPTYTGSLGGTLTTAAQTNITSVGTLGSLTVSGNMTAGNMTATNFYGDGSQLTGITASQINGMYSNTNVASYLLAYNGTIGGNIVIGGDLTVLGNSYVIHEEIITGSEVVAGTMIANANVTAISTTSGSLQVRGGAGITGAVFANNFVGDGSGLTGITASQIVNMYSNTNVAAYMPTYTGNIGTGAGYVFGNGYALTGLEHNTALINLQNGINHANTEISGLQTGLNTANTNIGNLQTQINEVNGFVTANAALITGLQTGLNTANTTIAGVQTGLNTANTSIGNLQTEINSVNTHLTTLDNTTAGLQTGLNTANTNISDLQTGLNTTNVTLGNITANVTTLQGQVYTNSNVANFLTTYTGNITAGNVTATGAVAGTYLYGNGYYLSGIGLDNATVGYHLNAFDTTTQTNAGTTLRNLLTINTTDLTKGITIVDNSKVTFQYNGTYVLTASIQLSKSDAGSDDFSVWLTKNGSDMANTNSIATLENNNSKGLVTVQYMVDATAGDYYQFYWFSADADMSIISVAAGTNPSRPAAPGVILTVTQVTNVQLPNGNIIMTGDVTGNGLLGSPFATTLANTTVVAGTYGGGAGITPVFTVDSKGRITSASNVTTALYSNTNVAAYIPTDSTIIGLQTGLNTANTNITGIQTGLNTANTTISTHTTEISGLQTGLNTANGRITTLESQTYANSNAVAYFSTYSGSLFHDLTITGNLTVSGATSTVNKEIVQTEEVVAGILTANANITSSSTGTGSLIVVGGVGISGDVYAATFNGDGSSLTNLANNTALQHLQTGLNTANTSISGLQTGLNTANTSISGLQTGLNTANTSISNNTANIAGLQTGLNTANSWIDANASMLVTTMSDVSGLMTNVITLQGQVYTNTNVAAYLPTYSGNLGNINNTGYVYGNGAFLTGIVAGTNYSNTNVAAYISSFPTVNINTFGTANISTSIQSNGNIWSRFGYILGDGSQLTGITASQINGMYSNTNVAAYMPTYAGNIGTGAGYIYGNGYYLTGISGGGGSYSNTNVANYFNNSSSPPSQNIIIVGDVQALGGPTAAGNISGYYHNGVGVEVYSNITTLYGSFTGDGSGITNLPVSYSAQSATGGANLRLTNGGTDTDVKLTAGSGISITRNSATQITITNTGGGGGGGTTSGFETTFLLMGA